MVFNAWNFVTIKKRLDCRPPLAFQNTIIVEEEYDDRNLF